MNQSLLLSTPAGSLAATPMTNNNSNVFVSHDIIIQKKLDRLNEVFLKCLDMSINSVTDQELQECFADSKKHLGSNLQRIYANSVSEINNKMENQEFPRINEEFRVKQTLEILHQIDPTKKSHKQSIAPPELPPLDDPRKSLRNVIKSLKRSEIEDLTNGIKFLEAEIKKSRDISGRLRTQMLNEIEALREEDMKIIHASNQSI
jgi:hypothetical protein